MCLVKFINRDVEIKVKRKTTLIECIRTAGFKMETPCNGEGRCYKCKVEAFGNLSEKTEEEKKHTENDYTRLACMTKILGDAKIKLFDSTKALKTINGGSCIEVQVDSAIKKVKLPCIDAKKVDPYINALKFKSDTFSNLKKIGQLEKSKPDEIYGITFKNKLLNLETHSTDLLGVALDIGTTGLSAYLVDLENGNVLNRVSALNPQTEYGGDVLSRITFSMKKKDGIDILSKCIRDELNRIIKKLTYKKYSPCSIYRIMIAANTTMLHLFLGISPDSIAKAPYRAVFLDELNLKARELDIHINEEGILTLIPSVSSYVGADITAGIIATDFHNRNYPAVFIDIGTNGEIAAISNGKMAASSTAAGPALEGMNISCGMRAEEGAIESFDIDDNFNLTYSTINNKSAKGICGSGLIDIAASLVKRNVILSTGRFNKELQNKLKDRIRDKKFYITDNVYISQKDIRQIQLAKAAISSGITMLLNQINISIESIEEIVIAGAFGYHINPESIKEIGLIPKGFNHKITFVGNSAVEGAKIALINENKLSEMSTIKNNIKIVELSTRDDFQDHFVKALNF